MGASTARVWYGISLCNGCQGKQASKVDSEKRYQSGFTNALHLERWQTIHAGDGTPRGEARYESNCVYRSFGEPRGDRRLEHGRSQEASRRNQKDSKTTW